MRRETQEKFVNRNFYFGLSIGLSNGAKKFTNPLSMSMQCDYQYPTGQ